MAVKQGKSNNRMVLLLIAGIPVTVILIATWLWYYVVDGNLDLVAILGTSNSGTLVQPPRQLADNELRDRNSQVIARSEGALRWTFLIPGGGRCAASCEKTLYTTRQIHVALGGDANRIRRIYLSDTRPTDTALDIGGLSDNRPAPLKFTEMLESEHPGIDTLTMASDQHRVLFREYLIDPSTWYLVDPAGWVMMSYDSEVSYKGVLSDLKFLLKNSSE